jgi:hypothetical protein
VLRRHPVLSLLTVAYGGALLIVELMPTVDGAGVSPVLARVVDLARRADGGWPTPDVVGSAVGVLLFLPLGALVLVVSGRRRWLSVVALGLVASCWIELAQGIWLDTRFSDPHDIVCNTLGTAAGVVVAMVAWRVVEARDRSPARARSARHAGA